jgi:hypothetical protein
VETVEKPGKYLKAHVRGDKNTAAATVLHLTAIKTAGERPKQEKQEKEDGKKGNWNDLAGIYLPYSRYEKSASTARRNCTPLAHVRA